MNTPNASGKLKLNPLAQALAIGLALGAGTPAVAGPLADAPAAPVWLLAQADADIPIYGSQLMTDAERDAYRSRWRAARSDEERERVRLEHHHRMRDRAQERGVTLPEEPPPRGAGAGPGDGSGPGPGSGGGRGPGPGPR
jgi:hypothetical protein